MACGENRSHFSFFSKIGQYLKVEKASEHFWPKQADKCEFTRDAFWNLP